MTEDELLEQIRKIDPDARVEERGGFRIIVTTAIAPNNVAFINPANMEIFPFEMDFGDGVRTDGVGWHATPEVDDGFD